MRQEDESAPRTYSGADRGNKKKAKKRRTTHIHIGPNKRALAARRAFCPLCDAERILRITDREREAEKASKSEREIRGSRSYGRDA